MFGGFLTDVFPTAIPVLATLVCVTEEERIELEKILDTLIEKTEQYPTVSFGDIVKSSHQNIIVETLELISNIIEILEPCFSCHEFSKIVNKLRYVTKGDLILPEDHNLVVDALKELLKCFKEKVGELDVDIMNLEFQINSLNYVKKGDPVSATTQNTKYKALEIASKLIHRIAEELSQI